MSNKRKAEQLVDSADVGCGGTLSEKHTISCRFGDFANLPHERGQCVMSPPLRCHGLEWTIVVHPRGDIDDEDDKDYVSIFLGPTDVHVCSGVKTNYCLIVDGLGELEDQNVTFDENTMLRGHDHFAKRDDILDCLDEEGALLIKADIQIFSEDPRPWIPKKKLSLDMLQLLDTADFADVAFRVIDEKFPAHRSILKTRAPMLFSMVEDADGTEVDLTDADVEPATFRALLRYVYGDELPTPSFVDQYGQDLLELSDRFGVTSLKLSVEAEVVKSILDEDNAAEWILFADSHNCAFLKESAIAVFVSNTKAVRRSRGWPALKESAALLDELMESLEGRVNAHNEKDIKNMSVSTLREKLEEKGLDVDGTREMLVERLDSATIEIDSEDEN